MHAARAFGLKAAKMENMTIRHLMHFIDQHKPVICAMQAWEGEEPDYSDNDSGHYVVAIGYDDNYILFQDPSIKNNRRGRLTHEEFVKRWHDIDKDHRVLTRFGIIVWREDMPEDIDTDTRASRIKMGKV